MLDFLIILGLVVGVFGGAAIVVTGIGVLIRTLVDLHYDRKDKK